MNTLPHYLKYTIIVDDTTIKMQIDSMLLFEFSF